MPKRDQRAAIAAETLVISQTGGYTSPGGVAIVLREVIETAVHETVLVTPGECRALRNRAAKAMDDPDRTFVTTFEVCNETTFAAARRLVTRFGSDNVAALNFASAKNPGGGFLNGAQAQEESLTRASALYACLQQQMAYYEANRREKSPLYTDHLIVSPCVPVFRDDTDVLLEKPWEVTVITAPAPNTGAIAKNEPESLDEVEPTFRRRIEHVLAAAVAFDQTAIVLGAWGCGVFDNDPEMVANLFGEFLIGDGAYATAFEHVAFAVLDPKGTTIQPFAEWFQA